VSPRFQPIYDLAELCFQRGITQAVLCPGSRCAPLTLAFARHEGITVRTFSDERSAAFIASGMAHETQSPVVLVCTSGSAAYHFAPAIAEAYFQEIPLIVFTADRPKEWIDQYDGQTIRQTGIYGSHVKKSFSLPEDYEHPDAVWYIHRIVNEAISLAKEYPQGPVHINAPFREPLYPAKQEKISYTPNLKTIQASSLSSVFTENDSLKMARRLEKYSKILVLAGQGDFNKELSTSIEKFSRLVPVVGDILSNLHTNESTIRHADIFLEACPADIKKSLQPELLITFGKSILSKNTKLFLRKYKPQEHWHILPTGTAADTFQSLSEIIYAEPAHFFKSLLSSAGESNFLSQKKENFKRIWEAEEHRSQLSMKHGMEGEFSELLVLQEFIAHLPPRCNLHLANSMSVRYANFIGLEAGKKGIRVFSNRGTSGIDGCTSTAVGHALCNETPHFLLTGDVAFFYDRNAFWHNYPLPNLHILLLNNHGGTIFNMIDGPADVPELNTFFVTDQRLSARLLCTEFGYEYECVDTTKKIKNAIQHFLKFDGKTKILETISTHQQNKEAFLHLKQKIKKGYET